MSDCKLQLGCLCVVGYLALVYCRERRHAAHRGPAAGAPPSAKFLIFLRCRLDEWRQNRYNISYKAKMPRGASSSDCQRTPV